MFFFWWVGGVGGGWGGGLFCFGGALFKPTLGNQHVLFWNVMKIRAFFIEFLYSRWLRLNQFVYLLFNLIKCKVLLMVSSRCGFKFSPLKYLFNFCYGGRHFDQSSKMTFERRLMIGSFLKVSPDKFCSDEIWWVYMVHAYI